ncbi:GntR family transcriptional regulator [Porphyromonas gingivalis]|uniref:Putative transcriptional regulator n=1 Tax=Porphyromonas gingivalis (strain ATCC 33277 / DSM 20709 / CIP 103683 / JCM 12257 / NCTC 11834 / 2561) TaxID=431947 RepID=B2RKH0_PORG3|nr:GntR family transcriptional regulator [Porphyromonas gingivalis]AIJ35555.1 GntR family transcriptional regulator [Porphyromonas gingivalis]ALJ25785.1 putative transcriptional regulator [Porphyromonas gingivalis 381]AUR50590.1 transcriptional repressor [Porphyromonas gingivalis ATCC 33277]MDR4975141.1 GntR family transcriptional regulator [Porphyromonas gingivalis]OWR80914.1 GntR family transcriptional regulator [Porphyromonas gingivalis SJD4]
MTAILQAQSIFLQISDTIKDRILSGEYSADERVPSVRELAEQMEVNPNTAMRAVERLQMEGMIYNKRGLGYFVNPNAREEILASRRKKFVEEVVPALFSEMKLLGIGLDTLQSEWDKQTENNS